MGAKDRPVPLTTVELARKLGKSQQLASKHLDEMERDGLIERIRSTGQTHVKLTKAGVASAASLYKVLDSAFGEGQKAVVVRGKVFTGLGEGAYYVSLSGYKKQFLSKLGLEPYAGTLNIRLDSPVDRKVRRDLGLSKGIHIEGFSDGKRSYGGAECFKALLNDKVKSAVLILERTSHDDSVLELISQTNIRQALKLKEGDDIQARIFLGNNDSSSQ